MTAVDDVADWRAEGACVSADPDLFFPISSGGASRGQEERAKAVCGRCGVRAECLAFAVATRQVHGVWGGLGEEELIRLQRSQRAPGGRPLPPRVPGTGRVTQRASSHRAARVGEPAPR